MPEGSSDLVRRHGGVRTPTLFQLELPQDGFHGGHEAKGESKVSQSNKKKGVDISQE